VQGQQEAGVAAVELDGMREIVAHNLEDALLALTGDDQGIAEGSTARSAA